MSPGLWIVEVGLVIGAFLVVQPCQSQSSSAAEQTLDWAYARWKSRDSLGDYLYWPRNQPCTDGNKFPDFVNHADLFHRNRIFQEKDNPFDHFQKHPHPFFTILEPTKQKFINLTQRSSPNSTHDLSFVLFVPVGFLLLYIIMGAIGFFFLPLVLGRTIFGICYGIFRIARSNFVRKIGRNFMISRELYNRQREVYYNGPLNHQRMTERRFKLSPFWRDPGEPEVPIVLDENYGAPIINLQTKTSKDIEEPIDADKANNGRRPSVVQKRKGVHEDFAEAQFEFVRDLEKQETEGKIGFAQKVPYEPDRASLRHVKEQDEEKRQRRRARVEEEKRRDIRRAKAAEAAGKEYARRGSHDSDYSSSSSTPEPAEKPFPIVPIGSPSKRRMKPTSVATGKQAKSEVKMKKVGNIFEKSKSRHKEKGKPKTAADKARNVENQELADFIEGKDIHPETNPQEPGPSHPGAPVSVGNRAINWARQSTTNLPPDPSQISIGSVSTVNYSILDLVVKGPEKQPTPEQNDEKKKQEEKKKKCVVS